MLGDYRENVISNRINIQKKNHLFHIEIRAKIEFLFPLNNKTRRYFTPSSLLTLYKAQIRPCLEYGSQLCREASKPHWMQFRSEQLNTRPGPN